jgi:8-oxo-dGTP pyrophosphatase MutT (NUDIX family)
MKHIKNFKMFEQLYFGTIGAGIVPFCKKTNRFLVGLRSNRVLEPNTWGGFGGKLDVENGVQEEIEKAAIRELEEETGYSGELNLLKGFVFKDQNFEYHNFIGVVEEEFNVKLNWENTSYKWVTYKELKNLQTKHFGLIRFLWESKSLFKNINSHL